MINPLTVLPITYLCAIAMATVVTNTNKPVEYSAFENNQLTTADFVPWIPGEVVWKFIDSARAIKILDSMVTLAESFEQNKQALLKYESIPHANSSLNNLKKFFSIYEILIKRGKENYAEQQAITRATSAAIRVLSVYISVRKEIYNSNQEKIKGWNEESVFVYEIQSLELALETILSIPEELYNSNFIRMYDDLANISNFLFLKYYLNRRSLSNGKIKLILSSIYQLMENGQSILEKYQSQKGEDNVLWHPSLDNFQEFFEILCQ